MIILFTPRFLFIYDDNAATAINIITDLAEDALLYLMPQRYQVIYHQNAFLD